MNTVKIRDIEIGAGAPKIIVPIVGITKEDIIEEAKLLILSQLMLLSGVQTGLKVFLILQRLKMY